MPTPPSPPSRSAKKTSPNKPKKARRAPPPDHATLDAFCQTIHFDEIPLETWETCLEDLDVRVPLWLAAAEALPGGERMVSFSRSTPGACGGPAVRTRVTCAVRVPARAEDGCELRIKGQGDHDATRCGDLIVTLHLKR